MRAEMKRLVRISIQSVQIPIQNATSKEKMCGSVSFISNLLILGSLPNSQETPLATSRRIVGVLPASCANSYHHRAKESH
jgi:hypothetical protein